MVSNETFISVVFALRNAEAHIGDYIRELSDILEKNFAYFEIIVVDNGSSDDTIARIEEMQARIKNIRLYCLPRNTSRDVALVAGLDNAIGDFVATLETQTDPPSIIIEMMKQVREGTEVVYALPQDRMSGKGIYNRFTKSFVRLLGRVADLDMPSAISTCRLFSRTVLNYMLEASDRHLTLPVAQALSGYRYETITYQRRFRSGQASTGSIDLSAIKKAFDLLLGTSMKPLRMMILLSLAVSVFSLFYAGYVLIVAFTMEGVAKGWPSMSLQLSLFFFLLFLILAVMGEYLLRITETMSRRPLYSVSRETHSSVMDYTQELNVDALDKGPVAQEKRDVNGRAG